MPDTAIVTDRANASLAAQSQPPLVRIVTWTGAGLFLILAAWVTFRFGGQGPTSAASDVIQLFTMLLMAAGSFAAARVNQGKTRLAWTAFALTGACWFVTQNVWISVTYFHGSINLVSGLILAVGFLLGTPLMVVATANLFGQAHSSVGLYRRLTDAVIVVASVSIVLWELYVEADLSHLEGAQMVAVAYELVYPIGDAIILALIGSLFVRLPRDWVRAYWPVAAGLVCISIADVGFAFAQSRGYYDPSSGFVLGWAAGEALIAYAAASATKAHHDPPRPSFVAAPTQLLMIAPVLAMAVLLSEYLRTGALERVTILMGFGIFLSLLVRHALGLREVAQAAKQRELAAAAHRALESRDAELRKLKEVDEFKTRLMNIASHELNTPISALRLQLYVLKQRLANEASKDIKDATGLVERNVERLGTLVSDTLDVARIQSGKLQVQPQPTVIPALVADVTATFAQLAAEKGINVTVDASPDLVARIDPRRFTQVLYNLVSNALKFTPKGGDVRIGARRDGPTLVIDVRDTGAGLNADQVARLFQPFVQVQEAPIQVKGPGLGLFISRNIVEQHGGHLTASSDGPGRGSCFTATVPADGEPAAAAAAS